MADYLVTGGAGFIGSHIVEELVRQGARVRVLDNFSTGYRESLARVIGHIELIEADLADLRAVRQAVEGVDYVLHQAADPSVPHSIADPIAVDHTNVLGTLHLLWACREAGVKRVVFASSCAVYGDDPTLPKREDMLPLPKSPYAASKLAGEQYCRVFTEVYGLEVVCLRYFNVFGPRQDPASAYAAVIPIFISKMLQGKSPSVHGDGLQSRDFVYVANVVQANLLAAHAANARGMVFNVAAAQRYSLLELVAAINDILGTDIKPEHIGARLGDIRHSLADISAIEATLGYRLSVDFYDGLRRTIEWHQNGRG